ncbi:MAG: metalloregulator ArsR/SmtB family transcription factor [Patescibacteria group bacterium]|jgi:DNA-binding transcriptional ArsR family regulator
MTTKIAIRQNKQLDTLAKQLLLVGDANRLKILCAIFNQPEICVSEIASELKLHIAVVSHHLQALSKAGLLLPKRSGKKICYSFSKNLFIKDLKKLICKCK